MPKQRKKARDSTAKARDSTATTTSTHRWRPKRANSSPNQPLTVQNDVLSLTTQNEAQRVPSDYSGRNGDKLSGQPDLIIIL